MNLKPTIAWERGDSIVVQCSNCGTLMAIPRRSGAGHPYWDRMKPRWGLGPCPACKTESALWKQDLPVGPFEEEE